MAIDQARTARGALAGVVAAGVWAAQAPLDKAAFGLDFDDPELLGRLVTGGPAAPVVGLGMHLANGAVFGAIYANAAPRVALPSWARGPAAGLAEHLASWPLMLLVDRFHPARRGKPGLFANPRAFLQEGYRHLLFGLVLGELERRLNPPSDPEIPSYEEVASSNGHGDLEAALAGRAS